MGLWLFTLFVPLFLWCTSPVQSAEQDPKTADFVKRLDEVIAHERERGASNLHLAVAIFLDRGDARNRTAEILERGTDPNARNIVGATPLHYAVYYSGDPALVVLLIDAGADVNAKTNFGDTPIHWAAAAGHSDVLEQLVTEGAQVNSIGKNETRPIHRAIAHGYPETVKELIRLGADPFAGFKEQSIIALAVAAKDGNEGNVAPYYATIRVLKEAQAKILQGLKPQKQRRRTPPRLQSP